MKRQLTSREIILLGLLLAVGLAGGYLLLFRIPMTEELERLKREKAFCEEQMEPVLAKVADKQRMEQELAEIFAADPDPVSLAPYDNQKPVVYELHSILQAAQEYALSFSTAEPGAEEGIMCRRISLSFTSGSYEEAREVLARLHESVYRCMPDDLSVSLGEGVTAVNVTLVYFEYQ